MAQVAHDGLWEFTKQELNLVMNSDFNVAFMGRNCVLFCQIDELQFAKTSDLLLDRLSSVVS